MNRSTLHEAGIVKAALTGLAAFTFFLQPASAAELRVPADHPTIQSAVDAAADGDIIHIAAGVYTNQVRILSKELTLAGQPGATLRATRTMAPFPGVQTEQFPLLGIRSSTVTIRGLTFEGERLAGNFIGPGFMHGIYLRESSAEVENCRFYGFREDIPGPEGARAITATGFESGMVSVRVAGCTFSDTYEGVFIIGTPDRQSVNVMIENNIIVGLGPLATDLNYVGIFIREGVGGRIAGNTISGFSHVGTKADFPISFAIEAANEENWPAFGTLQPLVIEANTLLDNQIHVALVNADNTVVRNNLFRGSAAGIIPLGLAASGTNVAVLNNRFEDLPEGIRLLGNDPMFGTILGRAAGTQVTSNRFCNVARRINVQPLASASEQATLMCPFPAPTMEIVPAVILAWPMIEEGYAVQAAPSPDGPWRPSGATPFLQDGRHSVSVPARDESRYFRLRKP